MMSCGGPDDREQYRRYSPRHALECTVDIQKVRTADMLLINCAPNKYLIGHFVIYNII